MRMRQQRSQKKQMRSYKKRNTYKKRAGAFTSFGQITRPDPMDVIYIYKYKEQGPCYRGKIVITRGTKEKNYADDKMIDYTGHEYSDSRFDRRRVPTEIIGRTQILGYLISNYLPDGIQKKYEAGMYPTTYKSVINNIKEYMKGTYIESRIKTECSSIEKGLKEDGTPISAAEPTPSPSSLEPTLSTEPTPSSSLNK
jgi:hypothetical protein